MPRTKREEGFLSQFPIPGSEARKNIRGRKPIHEERSSGRESTYRKGLKKVHSQGQARGESKPLYPISHSPARKERF